MNEKVEKSLLLIPNCDGYEKLVTIYSNCFIQLISIGTSSLKCVRFYEYQSHIRARDGQGSYGSGLGLYFSACLNPVRWGWTRIFKLIKTPI